MNDLCGMETIQRKSRWATGIWNLLTYYIDLKKKYDPFDPLLVENSGYFSSVPVELLCVIFIQHKPCNFRKIALVNRRFYALVAHYTKTWTQLHRLYTTFISSPIFSLTRDQLDYISRIYHRRGLIKAEKETLTKKKETQQGSFSYIMASNCLKNLRRIGSLRILDLCLLNIYIRDNRFIGRKHQEIQACDLCIEGPRIIMVLFSRGLLFSGWFLETLSKALRLGIMDLTLTFQIPEQKR